MADKALLIGINKYPNAPLRGCVNDMRDWADLLVERYKFKPASIRMLANFRARTGAIKKRLQWLIDCKPGDRVFFQFSGHGTQYPSRDYKHELDNLLEVICPFDFNWRKRRMITDKYFARVFAKIPQGVKFYWVSDCCHSGDLTRSLPKGDSIPRFYPQPADIAWRGEGIKQKGIKSDRAMKSGKLDVGFVSGCKSNQTSADALINGRYCGALSYHLIKNLKRMPLRTPLHKVVEATSKQLAKNGFSQKPQVEGAKAKKPFLS